MYKKQKSSADFDPYHPAIAMIETVQNLGRLAAQFFLIPKPEWSEDDIPDLSGRVMIVTG